MSSTGDELVCGKAVLGMVEILVTVGSSMDVLRAAVAPAGH
jgi:hypothetical protein